MGRAESKKLKDSNRMNRHLERRRQKKLVYTYIMDNAFSDYLLGETVSRSSTVEVISYMTMHVQGLGLDVSVVPEIEKGVVLSDPLGRGLWQPKNPAIKQVKVLCQDYPKRNYGINPNVHASKMLNPFGNVTR